MISVTRSYRFSASHRLHSHELTDAENERVYGKCNHPFGHGHDYVLEVTASGPLDPQTGLVIRVTSLDRLVNERIIAVVANRNLNADVNDFRTLVPTTENLTLVIARLLEQHWNAYLAGSAARLTRVRIEETDRNSFELDLTVPADHDELIEDISIHA